MGLAKEIDYDDLRAPIAAAVVVLRALPGGAGELAEVEGQIASLTERLRRRAPMMRLIAELTNEVASSPTFLLGLMRIGADVTRLVGEIIPTLPRLHKMLPRSADELAAACLGYMYTADEISQRATLIMRELTERAATDPVLAAVLSACREAPDEEEADYIHEPDETPFISLQQLRAALAE